MAKSEKGSIQLKVLYSEADAETAAAQTATMQKAGYQVETAIGRKAAQDALQRGKFDFVVLGGTLSRNDRHHLPYMVKKANKETRVVVMHTDGERHPYVDGNIDTGRSIEDLMTKIASMTGEVSQSAKAKAASAGR